MKMNVLYTCDNNYVWLMGISVISLCENNLSMSEINIYLLGENISDENKKILCSIAEHYNRTIIVIDVPKIDIPKSLVSARWPLSAFTRLYSGQLLTNEIKKVLYLDCDTIISGSIEKLEDFDISDYVVYGVKDCIGSSYKRNIGLKSDAQYVNAGVLLFNLENLRKLDIKQIIDCYMAKYERLINYADQDILNGVFKGKIGTLDPKYNVMTIDAAHTYKEIETLRKPTNFYTEQELRKAVNFPAIIHYTTNMRVVRPWFKNTNHPYAEEFRKYWKMSPWNNREFKVMQFTSKESKIIGMIMKLPNRLAYSTLGLIHSEIKPLVIRLKSKKGK